MSDRIRRLPKIEKIDPLPRLGTTQLDYAVVAERSEYFNTAHKRVVEQALQQKPAVKEVKLRSGMSFDRARLWVTVEPADFSEGSGRFVVHDTLQELFVPRVPHAAIGLIMTPMGSQANFKLGLHILGGPNDELLQALEARISSTPGTAEIQRNPKAPPHFTVIVTGSVQEKGQIYREALISFADISSTFLGNTKL